MNWRIYIFDVMLVGGVIGILLGLVVPPWRRHRTKRRIMRATAKARENMPRESFVIPGKEKGRFRRWSVRTEKGKGYYHTLR